ncbi:hypothetical protein M9H77_27104 [Catharanthus roseus]|uniref:Uncharacterized protein n=1 Tax=Catharanthus roseus TaxID=4058 RepID=A0ACC0ACK7_CATRO|nr:hypothetical protein M9H77_27104 [Catharanthus roseus]
MWQAGTKSKQRKFNRVMKEIQERNVDALDPEKWTLLHDGGHRHGIMIINISEALNSVLKKVRVLPLKAMVELIFNKQVKYFNQHREKAENCVHFQPEFLTSSCGLKGNQENTKLQLTIRGKECNIVKSPIRVFGMGNNVYTLRINNKSCSCGKWQTYTLPCSHILALCRENGSRTDTYVPEIYSQQT